MDQCAMSINVDQCRITFLTLIRNVRSMLINNSQCFSIFRCKGLWKADRQRIIDRHWSTLIGIVIISIHFLIGIDRYWSALHIDPSSLDICCVNFIYQMEEWKSGEYFFLCKRNSQSKGGDKIVRLRMVLPETGAAYLKTYFRFSWKAFFHDVHKFLDVNPLVRCWKWILPVNSYRPNSLMTRGGILNLHF